MTEIVAPTAIQKPVGFLEPQSFDEAWKVSDLLANSSFVPNTFKGKPQDVMAAIALGKELGFPTMQSLQNIAVINGRPTIWGDLFRALILSRPDLLKFDETFHEETQTANCHIRRRMKNGIEMSFYGSFSAEDARNAGLLGKDNYKKHLRRMLKHRALGFCGRDAYADALKGIGLAEEQQDYSDGQIKDVTPQEAEVKSRLEQIVEQKSQPDEKPQKKKQPKEKAVKPPVDQPPVDEPLYIPFGESCDGSQPLSTLAQAFEIDILGATEKQNLDEIYRVFQENTQLSESDKAYLTSICNQQAEKLNE